MELEKKRNRIIIRKKEKRIIQQVENKWRNNRFSSFVNTPGHDKGINFIYL